ncbi:hypothetical protein F8566_48485 [Actinomadura rudentiformis]|uniref:Ankyrin n=1 Tax=Actinomadura rudentiformis TaxID=359158 RepID=A0A6H9Y9M5_9ACTN|nr:hypothetical protein F8566_48485 [Actinomadura rudentiformis]
MTVATRTAGTGALEAWAESRGLKFIHIVLACGRKPSQPMVTLRTAGTLSEAHARTATTAADLRKAGFAVTRTKIEAAPWNAGVPASDDEAAPGRYFEHHVKLLLDADADLAALTALVVPHAAHLSHNARRVRADGRQERFVTQRCRGVGADTAGERLNALTTALNAAKHEIASVEREYVVFDDGESLDDGWIDEGRNGR